MQKRNPSNSKENQRDQDNRLEQRRRREMQILEPTQFQPHVHFGGSPFLRNISFNHQEDDELFIGLFLDDEVSNSCNGDGHSETKVISPHPPTEHSTPHPLKDDIFPQLSQGEELGRPKLHYKRDFSTILHSDVRFESGDYQGNKPPVKLPRLGESDSSIGHPVHQSFHHTHPAVEYHSHRQFDQQQFMEEHPSQVEAPLLFTREPVSRTVHPTRKNSAFSTGSNQSDDTDQTRRGKWDKREEIILAHLVYCFMSRELKDIAAIAHSCGICRSVRSIDKKLKRVLGFDHWRTRDIPVMRANLKGLMTRNGWDAISFKDRKMIERAREHMSGNDMPSFQPLWTSNKRKTFYDCK